jgi:hypothetical protein
VAVHTSEQAGLGAGGSAAARVSVDHPRPRADIEQLGRHLRWHGGLTLDYLHRDGAPRYIEANARTVEPGNPAASGVNLPALTIAISCGDSLPATPVTGRPGVRTHSSLALMLGAAERTGSRAAALGALMAGLGRRGQLRDSREVLTPLWADPLSLVPVVIVASQLLLQPGRAQALATGAVRDYAVPPVAVNLVRAARPAVAWNLEPILVGGQHQPLLRHPARGAAADEDGRWNWLRREAAHHRPYRQAYIGRGSSPSPGRGTVCESATVTRRPGRHNRQIGPQHFEAPGTYANVTYRTVRLEAWC